MKNNLIKLLTLFFTCCIILTGCGETGNNPAETGNPQAAGNQEADTAANADITNSATASTGLTGDSSPNTAAADDTGLISDSASNGDTAANGDSSLNAAAADDTAGLLNGEKHSVEGIITDATQYSVTIQTPAGTSYYLTIPETGVTGNLDYIIVGQMASLAYMGSLDENHAVLTGIYNSSLNTGIYVEEYAFAIKIINAVKSMDMKAISDLTNFPVFIDTGSYKGPMNTSGEFEVIDNEKIFTEALVNRMVNYNLFDLTYTDAGFVMGNGTPSITFDADYDGILGIIGINSAAAPAAD